MGHIPEALRALGKITADNCEVTFGVRENLSVPSHSHGTDNYVLVSAGTLYLMQEGVERSVSAGEWCAIPAGSIHAERFVEKTSVVVFWVANLM